MQVWLGLDNHDMEGRPETEGKGLTKRSGTILQLCLDECESAPQKP